MKELKQKIQWLRRDKIPFNIITVEEEKLIRSLFGIPEKEITFLSSYDFTKINIIISLSKQDIKDLLSEREGISSCLLVNEYMSLSEINVLSQGKELLPAFDDPKEMSLAESLALKGEPEVPGCFLKENIRTQGKLPVSRSVRVTVKYTDLDKIPNSQRKKSKKKKTNQQEKDK
ncbi:hypothetical protein NEFER03_0533 [Nematocida sp. LUAm3]|nr:hypothetical protein NEFER03_0533 [Nematocida sp. LUAm3]KAI5175500.1 hypothetical protein NEFER02_1406 [Nematocida sp. LUAm2]KAI5178470.1 hypothetical protein NEFER01_1617 [Nematocida sp. LUAm1]